MEIKKSARNTMLAIIAVTIGFSVVPTTNAVIKNESVISQVEAASYNPTHELRAPDKLRKKATLFSPTIMNLPKGAKVIVMKNSGVFSYVRVNDKYGYVKSANLKMLPSRYA